MCGLAAIAGPRFRLDDLRAMQDALWHRGPDAGGVCVVAPQAGLAHRRLSIIDLSEDGRQPMKDPTGRWRIAFNGEIYNYVELKRELPDYPFRTRTDTEVLLAAFSRWQVSCLDRLLGMFAFVVWDATEQRLYAVRDRFGVKPLYYHHAADGTVLVASEIKALHAAGVPPEPDEITWATYLKHGVSDHTSRTFWKGIRAVPPGHLLSWHDGCLEIAAWYDLADRLDDTEDSRPLDVVQEEYRALLTDSVGLRFRSDVPVGINLSGGLDSSLLLGVVHALQGEATTARAFTFVTGDPRYDELPWVTHMLDATRHPLTVSRLGPGEVPDLAVSVARSVDEPFGGVPTLAYARLFECARSSGVLVLLDGQGMDEQFAGYDYYQGASEGASTPVVQGTRGRPTRPDCLTPAFRQCARAPRFREPFHDPLRNLQYRDIRYTKIPRALRFNDRVSMRSSVELRVPLLDHRLVELALRQPRDRKIRGGISKWLPRQLASRLTPNVIREAPKRPLQTPQREWLRDSLRAWATEMIELALSRYGGTWLDGSAVDRAWAAYRRGADDTSFYVWQWVSLGLAVEVEERAAPRDRAAGWQAPSAEPYPSTLRHRLH
jgi:asparagine synthase (glutamine-hydrolysing)